MQVTCGYSGPANETTVPLSAFTDAGLMEGTVVGKAPEDSVVLEWAAKLLGIAQELPTDQNYLDRS